MENLEIINEVIRREGERYVNHPADRGGPTKYGITIPTLSWFRGEPVFADDIRNLTREEAVRIYHKMFIDDPDFEMIRDEDVREFMIDSGVLYGPRDPIIWLQQILGVKADGILGPITLGRASSANQEDLLLQLVLKRIRKISRVVGRDHTQAVFLEGWVNRTLEFI